MRIQSVIVALSVLFLLTLAAAATGAESSPDILEQSMSDTLDLWREGHYEQLYEHLAHRGKTSREQFVKKMGTASIRPACCFQKMENFKVLNEKRTEATVYVKIGLEGTPNTTDSCTREFKLTHEENVWKMQLSDVLTLSGASGKKGKHTARKKKVRTYIN